jgi:hypothetical protein
MPSDPIEDLRKQKQSLSALGLARQAIEDWIARDDLDKARNVWTLHVGSENCLVLEALATCDTNTRIRLCNDLEFDSALKQTAGGVWTL